MEFPYPQSMANCIVCHEDKLDMILTDEHLTLETCKSCHAMTGSEEYGTVELALETIIPSTIHGSMDWETVNCGGCHDFSDIHSGYDEMIYASEGVRYSDEIIVTIDDASVSNDLVTVKFSAESSLAEFDVEDIVPTVLVGMYGWDTKDFIIGPHERLVDDNNDGEISSSSGDQRALEYEVGEENPRGSTVSAAGGSWEVVIDMSTWGYLIDDGTVERLEIAVIPALEDAEGETIALDAVSRTFDLATNDFDDDFYDPIVKLEGCENCHDALATNYHSPDRGGSIVVCRLCHITKSGGSHLEMQSRSIDSYVHAIHSMQPFDMDDKDFSDEVEALHYEHHVNFPYPTHGITNCESCHYEGTYNVPDQTKSLPGLLSESHYPLEGWDRDIKEIPEYVTGPAARACGACHRAVLINEDEASELISLYQHMKSGGYLVEDGDVMEVISEIMAYFD
jgi:OmcA/MtrC family decaheme c-type cytochrome